MTVNKITQKITSYRIKKNDSDQPQEQQTIEPSVVVMHEGIKRHDELCGRTYKIKIPTSEHAIYVTVNHMNLDGIYFPYEVFINCKDVSHQQWITALTRLISAVFRKGGNVRFITEELMQVADPNGGHWTKKGENGEKPRFMPSLVAHIGLCIEKHLDYIDALNNVETTQKLPALHESEQDMTSHDETIEYPKNAEKCPSCGQKSAMRLDGCLTCLSCSFSKCG